MWVIFYLAVCLKEAMCKIKMKYFTFCKFSNCQDIGNTCRLTILTVLYLQAWIFCSFHNNYSSFKKWKLQLNQLKTSGFLLIFNYFHVHLSQKFLRVDVGFEVGSENRWVIFPSVSIKFVQNSNAVINFIHLESSEKYHRNSV